MKLHSIAGALAWTGALTLLAGLWWPNLFLIGFGVWLASVLVMLADFKLRDGPWKSNSQAKS
jgi:hypothetical protein